MDAYHADFVAHFDRFMEVYQGIHGTIDTKEFKLPTLDTLTDENVGDNITSFVTSLDSLVLSRQLSAILDEMGARALQLKYLLELE